MTMLRLPLSESRTQEDLKSHKRNGKYIEDRLVGLGNLRAG